MVLLGTIILNLRRTMENIYLVLVFTLTLFSVDGKNFCERFSNNGKDGVLNFTNPDMADIEFGTQQQFKEMHCCAKGFSHMMWYKNNQPYPWKLTDPDETYMEGDYGNQTLTFQHLLTRDTDYYTCVASNGTHTISHTKQLLVKPMQFTEKPIQTATPHCHDVKRLPGGNVTFYCEFYFGYGGGEDDMLFWYKINKTDGEITYFWMEELNNKTYRTEFIYRDKNETKGTYLYISNITSVEYATYMVKAVNLHGDVEVPIKLTYGDPNAATEWQYIWRYPGLLIALGVIILLIPVIIVGYCKFKLDLKLLWKYKFARSKDTGDRQCKYDLFISHSGSDKDFSYVRHVLMKYLEDKCGFKLCVEERDFLGGKAIADNVVESIEDSQSWVIVLTPDYLDGHWSPFQFQVALERSLKFHSHLIIIIARELPKPVNSKHWKTLKHVIGVTRTLKWKEDNPSSRVQFWKKLLLQLPKSPKGKPNISRDMQQCSLPRSSSEQDLINRLNSTSGESGYGDSPTDGTTANPLARGRYESVRSEVSTFSEDDITVSVESNKIKSGAC